MRLSGPFSGTVAVRFGCDEAGYWIYVGIRTAYNNIAVAAPVPPQVIVVSVFLDSSVLFREHFDT